MSVPQRNWSKVAAAKAEDVVRRFELGESAAKHLKPNLPVRQFFDALVQNAEYRDAANVLAYALPKREAVWWACACARSVAGKNLPAPQAKALDTAERWVKDPSEDNRRAAMPAAEQAELGTPAGCAALAAYFSGGSLAPPDVPAVPPAEHLTHHAAGCAVVLAAVVQEPEKAAEKYQRFFALGSEIAEGSRTWK